MLRAIGSVVRKELKDGLRDRRSVFTLFFIPIFFLALMCVMVLFMISIEAKSASLVLPVKGSEHAVPLMDWLREEGVKIKPVEGNVVALLKNREEAFVLAIDEDFPQRFQTYDGAKLTVIYDGSRNDIQTSVGRLSYLIQQWSAAIASQRLLVRGVSPQVVQPIYMEEVNVANDQQLASRVFAIIPIMLVMIIFTSSIGFSVDMMAGEREKNSLEPLLLNPVSRSAIVGGKWLTAMLCTLVVLLVTCVALYWLMPALPLEKLGIQYRLTVGQMAQALAVALPLVALATILQLLVSLFAKSFKEAQTYISLLVLVPVALSYYVLFSDVQHGWQSWLPVMGPLVVMESIFADRAGALEHCQIACISSLLLAMALAVVLTRQLKRERIIYG